jgi:hypothetical protein
MTHEAPLSLSKAQALGRYARGEIPLAEVDGLVRAIVPEDRRPRWVHVVSAMLVSLLAVLLVPASTRRN